LGVKRESLENWEELKQNREWGGDFGSGLAVWE
jgi:hypothetical protein